jgi:hypothetical protein
MQTFVVKYFTDRGGEYVDVIDGDGLLDAIAKWLPTRRHRPFAIQTRLCVSHT